MRYFSLQIQKSFTKFVDKAKKNYNLVIRALALTNMPVIKDMAPTFSESDLSINHTTDMAQLEELQAQLSEKDTILSEKDKSLAETNAKNVELSEKLAKIEGEKHEKFLSDEVEKLCLSEDQTVGFKGGEKTNVLTFVKTLSEEQAKAYFALHTNILTAVNLGEEGDAGEGEVDSTASDTADKLAKELCEKSGLTYSKAMERVLSENPELASKVY